MNAGRKAFLLAGLRAAVLKVKLMENELLAIGVSVKHGVINEEGAMQWLHSEGLLHLMPEAFQIDDGSTDTSVTSASPKPSPSNPASDVSPTS
jgi:hypothetical protein